MRFPSMRWNPRTLPTPSCGFVRTTRNTSLASRCESTPGRTCDERRRRAERHCKPCTGSVTTRGAPMTQQIERNAVDFDHCSPELPGRTQETRSGLRQQCPVARTEAHGGFWMALGYDEIVEAARDD